MFWNVKCVLWIGLQLSVSSPFSILGQKVKEFTHHPPFFIFTEFLSIHILNRTITLENEENDTNICFKDIEFLRTFSIVNIKKGYTTYVW